VPTQHGLCRSRGEDRCAGHLQSKKEREGRREEGLYARACDDPLTIDTELLIAMVTTAMTYRAPRSNQCTAIRSLNSTIFGGNR
jgi:hypothetical protein